MDISGDSGGKGHHYSALKDCYCSAALSSQFPSNAVFPLLFSIKEYIFSFNLKKKKKYLHVSDVSFYCSFAFLIHILVNTKHLPLLPEHTFASFSLTFLATSQYPLLVPTYLPNIFILMLTGLSPRIFSVFYQNHSLVILSISWLVYPTIQHLHLDV